MFARRLLGSLVAALMLHLNMLGAAGACPRHGEALTERGNGPHAQPNVAAGNAVSMSMSASMSMTMPGMTTPGMTMRRMQMQGVSMPGVMTSPT